MTEKREPSPRTLRETGKRMAEITAGVEPDTVYVGINGDAADAGTLSGSGKVKDPLKRDDAASKTTEQKRPECLL
jgi:hypothetical protein